ncbi:MAG: helix-turn-helix transcriptional regulator, partial [Clostridia bacterium]|nr:helix-turn-helix transcriptional regulator [Clostridia bacterium]
MVELKISEVISRERKRLDLTQEELAKALYVSPQAVSNWERGGYPDITLLPSIANFFGITVDELIGNDEVSVKSDIESFFEKY